MNVLTTDAVRVQVSDHALIRYMERVGQINLDAIRAEIAAKVRNGVDMGAKAVRHGDITFILDGPKVVTVIIGRGDVERKQ